MEKLIKNVEHAQPLALSELVHYEEGKGGQPHSGPAAWHRYDPVRL